MSQFCMENPLCNYWENNAGILKRILSWYWGKSTISPQCIHNIIWHASDLIYPLCKWTPCRIFPQRVKEISWNLIHIAGTVILWEFPYTKHIGPCKSLSLELLGMISLATSHLYIAQIISSRQAVYWSESSEWSDHGFLPPLNRK